MYMYVICIGSLEQFNLVGMKLLLNNNKKNTPFSTNKNKNLILLGNKDV